MTSVLRCISPIDGSVYAERPCLDPAAAETAVKRARLAQADWARQPLVTRIERVQAAVAALGAMNETVVTELAWQMGRPVRYGGEFRGVAERSERMFALAGDALAPLVVEDSDTALRKIEREPHGVLLVIAPWNYPYMTAINSIVPGLVAGNAVILKHAAQTLRVGERLAEAFAGAGLPEGLFQNLALDHATTTGLITGRRVDAVNFTGSVAAGQVIERAAAGGFLPLGLELGGKDPAYVLADADLDAALDGLVDAAFFNSGQSCCGIERIYVHQSLYADFLEGAISRAAEYRLGNPLDPESTLGPMAQARLAEVVRGQIAEAVAQGAVAHLPAADADDGGAYLGPQVLSSVTHAMRVMRDESFGPVVGILPVADDAEALTLMNDSPYGLTASLWTSDRERALALAARIDTGTVFMNRADYLDPSLCWTGRKDTGRGAALSPLGYHALTRPKSYHFRGVSQ